MSIVLVGNPNVGKSALFGALTGTYAAVSNYPGTTVEVTRGTVLVDGRRQDLLDTPGASSFIPFSEDERVTRDILLSGQAQAVVLVGDAKNLRRTLLLAVQLAEMEVPFVVCLNMMDEATGRGFRLDLEALQADLGVEVVPTVAVRREGLVPLLESLRVPRVSPAAVQYPEAVEAAVEAALPAMPAGAVSARARALMALAGDESLACVINEARLQRADAIAGRAILRAAQPSAPSAWRRRLETLTTHPLWGLPLLAAVLYAAYLFVGVFGAGTLVELLEDGLFGGIINPAAVAAANRWIGWTLLRDLLVGPYGLITMALAYSLALVLPIVGTFFVAFGALEDSGYLPRLAVLVNRLFKKIGLNGRAVLPMVLGLGCDTMATLTTRILETRRERLIAILLLALGVPCSAQLTVVVVLTSGLSPLAFAVWAFVVGGVMLAVGRLAALVLPGRSSDLVLELPPLRLPRPGNILIKTLARIEWYLKEAVPLFIAGTLLLFVADRLRLLGALERLAEPVLTGALGLPKETAAAFVVGFLRRDFGAAGLYRMAEQGRLDPVQIVVALVTLTLFIPCIANFFMIVKERGWRTGLVVAAFIFPFAVAVGAAVNAVLRAVALPLR